VKKTSVNKAKQKVTIIVFRYFFKGACGLGSGGGWIQPLQLSKILKSFRQKAHDSGSSTWDTTKKKLTKKRAKKQRLSLPIELNARMPNQGMWCRSTRDPIG